MNKDTPDSALSLIVMELFLTCWRSIQNHATKRVTFSKFVLLYSIFTKI